MKILLIGSGGREHALAYRLKKSASCTELFCAPGNPGIAQYATLVDIGVENIDALAEYAASNKVDLVVAGPEAPLVLGLQDKLAQNNIPCFGPSKAAAQLEGSKGFMKDLCRKYNIPTASYERFTELDKALDYISRQSAPIVVKADGLAAGKGVIVAATLEEAKEAAADMLSGNSFGNAGASIVVEEFLEGEEVSYFALCDGRTVLPFASAQDHKRVYDGDKGPNTGGMGAYSPARLMDDNLEQVILNTIINPTAKAMAAEGMPFCGVFFAGLMVENGQPKLLEYNTRFGDPECQTLMLRYEGDLAKLLYQCATKALTAEDVEKAKKDFSENPAICVVMAASGYPGSYVKNTVIKGLADNEAQGLKIFHAGTALSGGNVVSIGGRVLGVSAIAPSLLQARDSAYNAIAGIEWPEGFCRKDIGWRALGQQ